MSGNTITKLATATVGLAVLVALATQGFSGPAPEQKQMNEDKQQAAGNKQTQYSAGGYYLGPLTPDRLAELKADLSPEERRILLKQGTECAFSGALAGNKQEGTYVCRLCGLPLFVSHAKFESGTGWPSFFAPFDEEHVHTKRDLSHGMVRTEIQCARCGAHLGHVFNDGPKPTGQRYCVNSAALKFYEQGVELPPASQPAQTETAFFAGGCFWGVEDRFQQVPGVLDAVSGYQGGQVDNPTYQQVCGGDTGHAETVRVTFDPERVTYRQLLERFFQFHDPTQLNRQGPDYGTQYRSAIFAANEAQLAEAQEFIADQTHSERYRGRHLATVVTPAEPFYEAEDYHQDYHARHGGSCPISLGK